MSNLNLNREVIQKDENANSDTDEQENLNTTINMDLVKKEETTRQGENIIIDNQDSRCMDTESSKNASVDKNVETRLDIGYFLHVADLKKTTEEPNVRRKKFTVMGMYQNIFNRGQPLPQQPPPQYQQHTYPPHPQQPIYQRYTRQLWRQEPPPVQPQQTMWTQWGTNPNQGPGGYSGHGDYGEYGERGPLIYDPQTRNKFVGLVMAIVFVMLLATAGFLSVVIFVQDVQDYFLYSGWVIVLPAFIGLLAVNCTMMCSPCGRRPPCNFIMLILATACVSVIAAKITSHYDTEIILYAVVATGAVVFVCIILACSKFDFTSWMLYAVVIATAFSVLVMIILTVMFVTGMMMKPVLIIILAVGTLIQIVLLTMQLQMILGGRAIEMSEEDYALAAFMIYTSIIDIFLKLVHVIGLASD